MNPIITSSLVGAGSSLLSNIFGGASLKSTNKTNMRIAQMNNEWSERMMQKQMDYNTAQWEREAAYNDRVREEINKYNSASAQAQRLREAGINPALAMSGANAGTSQGSSAPSGNSVGLPSPSGATVQPYHYDFSGIGNAVNTAMQISMQQDKTAAEVNNLNAQADVARARAAADNAWTYERLKETRIGRLFLEQTFDVRKNQMNADYQNTLRAGRQMEENIKLTISQALLAQKELAIFDAERAAGIANTIADTLLKGAQRQLTKQQMIHEIQKMYKTSAESQGILVSNDVARRSADSIVESALQNVSYKPYEVGAGAISTILGATLGIGLGRLGRRLDKLPKIKGFGI